MNNMRDENSGGVVFFIEIQGSYSRTNVGNRPSCVDADESIKILGIYQTVDEHEHERDRAN